jgi:hypothetical protein
VEPIEDEQKEQLRVRVLERCARLQASLIALRADPCWATSDRARAVEQSLAALQRHPRGRWQSLDERESLALARWLGLSRFLVDGTSPP